MNRISSTLIRLSIGAVVGGAALLWSGQLPLELAIVARIISRSEDRPPADADELCGRCTAYHTPRGGWWSGGWRSGCWGGLLCGACLSPGCGSLWTDSHRLLMTLSFMGARRGVPPWKPSDVAAGKIEAVVCATFLRVSAIGTKRTCRPVSLMSAFGGKADMDRTHVCLDPKRTSASVTGCVAKPGFSPIKALD